MLSKENINRIIDMEKNISTLQQKTDDVCKEVSELKDTNGSEHLEIKNMIEKFIKTADERYASKRTEQLFYAVLGAMVIYVAQYVLRQVGI